MSVTISLDPFAHRQFDPESKKGLPIVGYTKEEFVKHVNRIYEERKKENSGKEILVDGYAPFCKHLFIPNFTQSRTAFMKITKDNEQFLKSAYKARREGELTVLSRWFPKEKVKVGVAKYLDLILYSRKQINKENEATGAVNKDTAPWGIVSIKPQDVDHETPMAPITMMRNALPLKEGGSGEKLDHKKYKECVDFFQQYANVL